MRKKQLFIKIVSLLVAGVFLHQQIVWAQGNVTGLDKVNTPTSPPSVSNELAQVDRMHINGSKETVINIQDAHSSLSAQYSIVNILKELAANYDLSVVAIEGGAGYIDTSILKSLPDEEIKEKTARFLMKEGKISAGEFFSATYEGTIGLYGVEDNDLYQENLELFRDIHEKNRENISVLRILLNDLQNAGVKIYSKDLTKFVYKSRLHRKSKISFDIYWGYLDKLCHNRGIETEEFKDIKSFTRSIDLEKNINFEKATSERKELIDEAMQNLSREDVEILVQKSISFEKGQIDQAEYHLWLLDMAGKRYIDTERFTELQKFVDYINAYRELDVIGLSRDLENAEEKVLGDLVRNQKERDLYELTRAIELMKGLFEIKLTDEDVTHLKSVIEEINTNEFSRFTENDITQKLNQVISDAKGALKFYEIAEERNHAMLANTVQAMRREGKTMAALVSGGHHSYGLTELMKEKGLSYLVLMPKTFNEEERPYVAILTKKTGPYRELVKTGDYDLALEAYMDTGDLEELEELFVYSIVEFLKAGANIEDKIDEWVASYEEFQRALPETKRKAMEFKPAGFKDLRAYLESIKVEKIHSGSYDVAIGRNLYTVTDEEVTLIDFFGEAIKEPLEISDIERFMVRYDAIRSAVLTVASHGIPARVLSSCIPAITALMPIIKAMSARPEPKKEAFAEKAIMADGSSDKAPGDDIAEVKVPTILEAATMNIEKAAEIMEMDPALKEILLTPVSVTEAGFEVSLEDGSVIKMWAFRVLQNDALGPGKGGLRWLIVKGETLEEAKKIATGLATLMSVKNSGVGIPYGGGKGDIVIDEDVNKLFDKWQKEETQLALKGDKKAAEAIRAKSDRLKARIVRGFSRALTEEKAVGTFIDVPAPDMGTDSRMMAWFCDEHLRVLTERGEMYDKVLEGFLKTVTPNESAPCATLYLDRCLGVLEADTEGTIQGIEIGVVTGKPVGKGGSEGRTKATGFGGFLALGDVRGYFSGLPDINKHHIGKTLKEGAKNLLKRGDLEGVSVGIQGTGNVGEYNAWEFYHAKAKVTLLQDAYCTLYSPDGIDLELLDKELERLPDGRWASLATISQEFLEKTGYTLTEDKSIFWETYTEIKVPAAVQNQITLANAEKVAENCEIILELANNPTSPLADEVLRKTGVLVIPDVMANAGGVTVSYFEWLQNIEGRYHNEKSIDKMLEERVRNEVTDVMRIAVKFGVDMRIGAYILSLARIANAEIARRDEKGTLQLVGKVPYKYYGKLELNPMTVEGLRRGISGPDKLISKQKRTPGFIKLVKKSEKKHSKQIREITTAISSRFDRKRRGFIMVSGAPTSGKIAVSKRIVSAFEKKGRSACKIDIDLQVDEHIERLRARGIPPETLHKIRIKKALQFLEQIRDSGTEPMDILILEEGEIKSVKFRPLENEIIVLEGDYTLSDEILDKKTGPLRNEQTFGIFVNVAPSLKLANNWPLTSLDLRFMRQILTFTKLFEEDILDIVSAWPAKREDSIKYIYPTWKNADVTFNSYLPYELPVLKAQIEPLLRDALERVDRVEAIKAINHLLFILEGVPAVEADDIIPEDSIIRQFIGKKELRPIEGKAAFAEPSWKKSPLYLAAGSVIFAFIASLAFSQGAVNIISGLLAAVNLLYFIDFAFLKHFVLGGVRKGRIRDAKYNKVSSIALKDRVGGIFNRVAVKTLDGPLRTGKRSPEIIIVDDDYITPERKIIGADYAVFDTKDNKLYILGSMARAPDWVLAPVLTHEVAHTFTDSEFQANLFLVKNLKNILTEKDQEDILNVFKTAKSFFIKAAVLSAVVIMVLKALTPLPGATVPAKPLVTVLPEIEHFTESPEHVIPEGVYEKAPVTQKTPSIDQQVAGLEAFVKSNFAEEIIEEDDYISYRMYISQSRARRERLFTRIFRNKEAGKRVKALNRWVDENWDKISSDLPDYAKYTKSGKERPVAQQKALFLVMVFDPEMFEYLSGNNIPLWLQNNIKNYGHTYGSRGLGRWGKPVIGSQAQFIEYEGKFPGNYLGLAMIYVHEGQHARELPRGFFGWIAREWRNPGFVDYVKKMPPEELRAYQREVPFFKRAINIMPENKDYYGDDYLDIAYEGQKAQRFWDGILAWTITVGGIALLCLIGRWVKNKIDNIKKMQKVKKEIEERRQRDELQHRDRWKGGSTRVQQLVLMIALAGLAMHSWVAAAVVVGVIFSVYAVRYISSIVFTPKAQNMITPEDLAMIFKKNFSELMKKTDDFRQDHVKSVIRHFEALVAGDFEVFWDTSRDNPEVKGRILDKAEYFSLLGRLRDMYLSLSKKQQEALYLGVILHDIGFTVTPDSLLHMSEGEKESVRILEGHGIKDKELIWNVKKIVLGHQRFPDIGADWLLTDFPEEPAFLQAQLFIVTLMDYAGKINRERDPNVASANKYKPSQMEDNILSTQLLKESLDIFERLGSITDEEFLEMRLKYGGMKRPFQISREGLELNESEINYLKAKGAKDPVLISMWSHHIRNPIFPLFKLLKMQEREDYPRRLLKLMMLIAYATSWYLEEGGGYEVLTLDIDGDDHSDAAYLRILDSLEGLFNAPIEDITPEAVFLELYKSNGGNVFGISLRFEDDRLLLRPGTDSTISEINVPPALADLKSSVIGSSKPEKPGKKDALKLSGLLFAVGVTAGVILVSLVLVAGLVWIESATGLHASNSPLGAVSASAMVGVTIGEYTKEFFGRFKRRAIEITPDLPPGVLKEEVLDKLGDVDDDIYGLKLDEDKNLRKNVEVPAIPELGINNIFIDIFYNEGRAQHELDPENDTISIGDPHPVNCKFCKLPAKELLFIKKKKYIKISGSPYAIAVNKYPYFKDHILLFSGKEEEHTLSRKKIEDLFTFQKSLGGSFSGHYNGVGAGATSPHFHGHFRRAKSAIWRNLEEGRVSIDDVTTSGSVRTGLLKGYPGTPRIFEGSDIKELADEIWKRVTLLREKKIPHNLDWTMEEDENVGVLFRVVLDKVNSEETNNRPFSGGVSYGAAEKAGYITLTNELVWDMLFSPDRTKEEKDAALVEIAKYLHRTSLTPEEIGNISHRPDPKVEDITHDSELIVEDNLPEGSLERYVLQRLKDIKESLPTALFLPQEYVENDLKVHREEVVFDGHRCIVVHAPWLEKYRVKNFGPKKIYGVNTGHPTGYCLLCSLPDEEILFRVIISGHVYIVAANMLPCMDNHIMLYSESRFPQDISGKLQDIFLFLHSMGPEYEAVFNSAGLSKLRHYHTHVGKKKSFLFEELDAGRIKPDVIRKEGDFEISLLRTWRSEALMIRGKNARRIQEEIDSIVSVLKSQNTRHSIVMSIKDGVSRAIIFPITDPRPTILDGVDPDGLIRIGGSEVAGDLIIPSRDIWKNIKDNPDAFIKSLDAVSTGKFFETIYKSAGPEEYNTKRLPLRGEKQEEVIGDVHILRVDPKRVNMHLSPQEELNRSSGIRRDGAIMYRVIDGKNALDTVDDMRKDIITIKDHRNRYRALNPNEVVFANTGFGNLLMNKYVVSWEAQEEFEGGLLYHVDDEDIEGREYYCGVYYKNNKGFAIKRMRFNKMSDGYYRAIDVDDGDKDITDELEWAGAGQSVVYKGEAQSIHNSWDQYHDIRHLVHLPFVLVEGTEKGAHFGVEQFIDHNNNPRMQMIQKIINKEPVVFAMELSVITEDGIPESHKLTAKGLRAGSANGVFEEKGYRKVDGLDKLKEQGDYFIDEFNKLHIILFYGIYPHHFLCVTEHGKLLDVVVDGRSNRVGLNVDEAGTWLKKNVDPNITGAIIVDNGGDILMQYKGRNEVAYRDNFTSTVQYSKTRDRSPPEDQPIEAEDAWEIIESPDFGSCNTGAIVFKMGIPEEVRQQIIDRLEDSGIRTFRYAKITRPVGLDSVVELWADGLIHSLNDMEESGIDVSKGRKFIEDENGRKFKRWFDGIYRKMEHYSDESKNAVQLLAFSLECLNKGMEVVLLDAKASREQLAINYAGSVERANEIIREELSPDLDIERCMFQDFVKRIIVGPTNVDKAQDKQPESLRGGIIKPQLHENGHLKKFVSLAEEYSIPDGMLGLIANGIHCATFDVLYKEINLYLAVKEKTREKAFPVEGPLAEALEKLRGSLMSFILVGFGIGILFLILRNLPGAENLGNLIVAGVTGGEYNFLPTAIGFAALTGVVVGTPREEGPEDVNKIMIGVPDSIYVKLGEGDVEILEKGLDIKLVRLESASREEMVDELVKKSKGTVFTALLDEDAISNISEEHMVFELANIIENLTGTVKENIFPEIAGYIEADRPDSSVEELMHKEDVSAYEIINSDITGEKLKAIDDIWGFAEMVIKVLPEGRSYRLADKSVREMKMQQMRMEKSFAGYSGNGMGYTPSTLKNTDKHYFVHFADGDEILNMDAPAIIPPGLEIEKRRQKMKVAGDADPNEDRFFIVLPEGKEKKAFKKEIMDLWMLDGVVSDDNVVILNRELVGYKTSDLLLSLEEPEANRENTGFRTLTSGLEYDDLAKSMDLLQVDVPLGARSTLDQYEVFVNLILMRDEDGIRYKPSGLQKLEGGRYLYIRKAHPVDLEDEVRRYYFIYVRQVLIKA